MRALKPRITKRCNPGGSISYCVDAGIVEGRRPRKFFANKNEARRYAKQMLTAKRSQGALAFTLTSRQQVEAAKAFKDVEAAGVSLTEAIAYYLRHAQPKNGTKAARALTTEFLESKIKKGKKPRYIKELRCKLNKFSLAFAETPINEISRAKFEDWLDSQKFSLVTKKNYLRDLGMLFKFALVRGYCAENVIDQIEKPVPPEKPVEIFTVGQALHFLFAVHVSEPKLIPYVAIGLFAGLRSCELEQLDWNEINLNRHTIEVKADKSKTSRRRIVEVSDNLHKWLKPYETMQGPIVSKCWREKLQNVAQFAELPKWPPNVLRHSFGSYHFAKHQNASKTAFEMGHSTSKMLFQHYRALVQPEEAERFWNILPPKGAFMYPPVSKSKGKSSMNQVDSEALLHRISELVSQTNLPVQSTNAAEVA